MGRTNRRLPEAVEFGGRVRELRQQRELTQQDLASAAGMHFTYVSSLERGERNVSLENILRLAAALEVDAGQLIEGLTPSEP